MLKVIVTEFLTLDGVMEEPTPWQRGYSSPEIGQFKYDELFQSDALLLGRVTYKGFAKYWPTATGTGDFGERMNSLPKFVATLSLFGVSEQLEVRELEGSCTQTQVMAYLETLAESCNPKQLTVIVLDNAPFHKGRKVAERRAAWEAKELFLRYLPAYSPQLNLIEDIRRKKGFLMPRRCYGNLNQ